MESLIDRKNIARSIKNMATRSKNKKFTVLSELLETLLDSAQVNRNIDVLRLWDAWEEAVGSEFSKATRPAVFKDNLLIVHVKSAAWLYQLQFQEEELRQNLNQYLGENRIGQIRFKIGDISIKPSV